MRYNFLLLAITATVFLSCKKDTYNPPPPVEPEPDVAVLLKEIVIPNLPSPYYHFEYNTDSTVKNVSFASGFTNYDVLYDGNRISEMRNNIIVNKDRLQYVYDNAGHLSVINYADSNGVVYKRSYFTYGGDKIIKIEREIKLGPGFIIDRTMTMSYHGDGNLKELSYHRPALNGQSELTYTDRFEQYDDKTNVDGFSLVHEEFFEHLFLLPGVKLQKNNPGKVTRTGDGVNYIVDYTYTFNAAQLPLTKKGQLLFTSGADTGKKFQTNSTFSYYE